MTFWALVVVPLVPMLKRHLIKQHSIDIKAELLKTIQLPRVSLVSDDHQH